MIVSRNTSRYELGLLATCALFAALNARWIWLFRRGQPIDGDEATYLSISWEYYLGFLRHGVSGWIAAIQEPNTSAPVPPALASLAYLVFGPHVLAAFIVPLLAGVVTVAATYFIGKSIGDQRVGLVSSVVVASSAIVINYARTFNFALPVTAMTTLAMLALIKSNLFTRIGWAVVFGAALGLIPLTRTMGIAFVPGFVVAGLVQILVVEERRMLRARVFVLSMLVAIGVAALWLVPNARNVFGYLWSFGYGSRNVDYGPPQSLLTIGTWLFNIEILLEYLYVPLVLVLAVGACLVPIAAARAVASAGFRDAFRAFARSGLLPLVILVIEGFVALTSSRNKGSAFTAPLVPAMILIAAWAALHLGRSDRWRAWVSAVLVTFAIVSALPFIDLRWALARPWQADVPYLSVRIISDGRAPIQTYEESAGYSTSNPSFPVDFATGQAWIDVSAQTARRLSAVGDGVLTAYAFRGYLYNTSTVGLAQLQTTGRKTNAMAIVPEVMGNSVDEYVQWLQSGAASGALFLLTSSGVTGDFRPYVDPGNMEAAAERARFMRVDKWTLPDGRVITMWKRTASS